MFYLFDPITCERKQTTYELLEGITGIKIDTLRSYKHKNRKIASINCYIIDDTCTSKQLVEYMEREVINDEYWIDIPNSKTQVSNYGRYRSLQGQKYKLMMVYKTYSGRVRPQIRISLNDGTRMQCIAHTWVCKMFLGEKPNGFGAWHKDENIWNNRANNLCYKSKHFIATNTAGKTRRVKPVVKVDVKTGEVLDEYASCAEAGRHNYMHKENISACLRGVQKTAGGFKWRYALDC